MALRTYTPDDIVRILLRRRWLVLLPFAVGLALAPLLARFAPAKFRSESLIQVVPQRVPNDYVKATVTDSVQDRLPAISEQIQSRSRLEQIIADMNLYPEERQREVMEDVVQRMRGDITLSLVGTRDETNAFRLQYVSNNAETARRVTERLATLYIEQNLKDRESQANNTSQFLESQLVEAKRRLVEHEKKLEDYRKRNAGQLPTQLQGNLQAIQNASIQLQQLNDSMNRALERRLFIERQLADAKNVVPAAAPALPATGEVPANASAAQQLELAKARLVALRQRYTDDHFEVRQILRLVEELQQRLELEGPVNAGDAAAAEPVLSPAEAAQRKAVLTHEAELAMIDRQVETAKADIARLRQVINDYQYKVDALPTRESELVELTRDYDTLQMAYSSLLMKRVDSNIAENLESRQIGEQFKILDPASTPAKPFNQNQRLGIMASGAIAGLVLGLVGIVLLELKDSSFRREEDVMKALQLPVLALVPLMTSDHEQRTARRRSWAVDLAGSAVVAAAVVVVVYWRLQ